MLNDPVEYMRGVAYSLMNMMIGGCYAGEFDPEFRAAIKARLYDKSLRDVIRENPMIWLDYINARVVLNVLSDLMGRLVVLMAFCIFGFAVFRAISHRNGLMIALCMPVAYQWTINAFISNMRSYMSSVYLLCLVVVVYGVSALCLRRGGKKG